MLKEKKKIIITVIIIALILIIIFMLKPVVEQKTLEQQTYSSVQAIPTNEAAVTLMKCKYIKEEASSSSSFDIDIYVEFGRLLFTGTESNEIYYSQLTQIVAVVNQYKNFRLIDEKNEIVVAILCSDGEIQRTIINGEPNYYGKVASLQELQEFTRPETTTLNVESELLKSIIENNWSIKNINLGTLKEEWEDKYFMYPETSVKIKTIDNTVFHMMFIDGYEDKIVNGLDMNSTLEEVVSTLGEPTFGSIEEKVVGYKSNELYVFFSEYWVSVYRVDNNYSTSEFEAEIEKYQEEKNLKTYISNITDIWPDYDNYYYDANTVDLSYILKGVKIQYGITGNHGVTFYTNYKGKVNNKEIEELQEEDIPDEVYFENKDSVAEYEMSRVEQEVIFERGEDL